jgi:transposase
VDHGISIEVDGRNCIGLDLGDRWSVYHVEDALGKPVKRDRVRTWGPGMTDVFQPMKPSRIALEVGTHSPWVYELLTELGHEVTVANAYRVSLISRSQQKGDDDDAEKLCWLLRADPRLLFPIQHRGLQTRADLTRIRAREALVRSRTLQINFVRGSVKSFGQRIPSASAGTFHQVARDHLPEKLREVLHPHLEILAHLTSQIRSMKKKIERMCQERYPETRYLLQVNGVGPMTALTFVLTIEDPSRFERGRDVAAYLGLVPRRRASGCRDPELSITKSGDGGLRRLLVQCAHHILGPMGRDSDLREWGEALAARGKKNAKKRAAVAVARKLSVILLSLWTKKQDYLPFKERAAA